MARVITQETFDDVVKENIEEFDMTADEAVDDAAKQFIAQGVDLSCIIMDKLSEGQQRPIIQLVEKLGAFLKNKSENTLDFVESINKLKQECDKGLAQKVLAGNQGAYDILLDTLESYVTDRSVIVPALYALISMMTGNPDLLNLRGVNLINSFIDNQDDPTVIVLVLKWTRQCCIKHEMNRQLIFDNDILLRLKSRLYHVDSSAAIIRAVCGVVRALVLDDDIRVEFGRAHEHARQLSAEVLCGLTDLLTKFKEDAETVGDLMQTLSALVVKDELCQKVEASGGLLFVRDVMKEFPDNEKLSRQCLKLLKALCGNDDVKAKIIGVGCGPLIVDSMQKNQASVDVALAGCAAIAALTLRSPANSKTLFDAGAPEQIVEVMRAHKNNADVQKQASWAVRNMVSRDRTQCSRFLTLGVEPLLREALSRHKARCEYDAKAALRDLGCDVELKERWTGKGGKLN